MNEPNFQQESSLDSLIERTLTRDAEATRARFTNVPNARLTAKLALSTASRGVWGTLRGKLALYAAGALVVGAAIYFFPSLGQQNSSRQQAVPPSSTLPVQQPLAGTQTTERTETGAKHIALKSVSKMDSEAMPRQTTTSEKPVNKLDEGDDGNVQKIVDPHYHTK
jgi:hypothetical protein